MRFLSPMVHRFAESRVRDLLCLTVAVLFIGCETPAEKVAPADDTSSAVDTAFDAADTGADTVDTGTGLEDTAPDGAHNYFWSWTSRNRKDLSCNGEGNTSAAIETS